MHLAILVVYLVRKGDAPLLRLQLERIARHTRVPYTIYAAANRLHPRFRSVLEARPEVRICPCQPTVERGKMEHAWYLEQLVSAALEDDVTHLVTLHVDSFPVRTGWAGDLAARCTDSRAFVTLGRVSTACLFVPASFVRQHRPRLYPDEETIAGAEYQAFRAKTGVRAHTGAGYAWAAYRVGMRWDVLPETTRNQPYAHLYDRTLFHLKGAVRIGKRRQVVPDRWHHPGLLQWLGRGVVWIRQRVPRLLWRRARRYVVDPRDVLIERPLSEETRRRLFTDPVAFLGALGAPEPDQGALSSSD